MARDDSPRKSRTLRSSLANNAAEPGVPSTTNLPHPERQYKLARNAVILLSISLLFLCTLKGRTQSPPPTTTRRSAAPQRLPDVSALRETLNGILAQPDFRRAMRATSHDPRNLREWLLLRIQRLFQKLGGLQETNYALFLVSVIVGSILLLALVAHIAYTIAAALRRSAPKAGQSKAAAPVPPKNPDEYLREAEELAARQACREAIRALYLGLIRTLQLKGLLPRTTAQTNREQLHHLRQHSSLVAVMQPFVETFEAKWYGQRPATTRDVEQCRAWFVAALRQVETR